jgi:hypothetical protein
VRETYRLFHEHRALIPVVAELARRGWTTKAWTSRQQVRHTGRPFTKASLRLLLKNPTYAGRVRYRGEVYDGEHPAIVDPVVWDDINAEFEKRAAEGPPARERAAQEAPLAGVLRCERCDRPMVATYTEKRGKRYRYYVCESVRQKGWKACATKSVSAALLEASLLMRLQEWFTEASAAITIDDSAREAVFQGDLSGVRNLLADIRYGSSGIVQLKVQGGILAQDPSERHCIEYQIPGRQGRSLPAFPRQGHREVLGRAPKLSRLVALAHKLEQLVQTGCVKDFSELARLARVSAARIGQIVILAQLAPAIQEQILFLSSGEAGKFGEADLRAIAREPRWNVQLARFGELIGNR